MDYQQVKEALIKAIDSLESEAGVSTEEAALLIGKAVENAIIAASGKGDEAAAAAVEFATDVLTSVDEFVHNIFD